MTIEFDRVTTPDATPAVRKSALVVVVVGTDYHPFDRLVSWADTWATRRGVDARTMVQFGTSRPPSVAEAVPFLAHDDLQRLFAEATTVVSHGGPSTIIEACRYGHVPIVVPRSPTRGEHVDGHQQRFAAFMAERGMIRLASSEFELADALDRDLYGGPPHAEVSLPVPSDAAATVAALVTDLSVKRSWRRAAAQRVLDRHRPSAPV